jgi:hypothetical protein
MDIEAVSARLWVIALTRATPAAAAWLCGVRGRRALADVLPEAYAAVTRKVGAEVVRLEPTEAAALSEAGAGTSFDGWTLDELSRAGLLMTASLRVPAERFEALLRGLRASSGRGRRGAPRAIALFEDLLAVRS